jgi:hypothetical protein
MGGYTGAPISVVLELEPTATLIRVEQALGEWLEKAHGVSLETADRDELVVEWRKSEDNDFVCQLVASDVGDQTRRTVTVFSDGDGLIAIIDETPLGAPHALHTIVDLSERVRLLLNTLLPVTPDVMGLRRGELTDFAAVDSNELLSELEEDLKPGILVAVTADDAAPSIAQQALLSDLSGLAIVGSISAAAPLLTQLGTSLAPRIGSVVSVARTANGLDAHIVASTSLRTKLDSARRLVVRRQLSAPIPFDLERRRSAAMSKLLAGGHDLDLPTALLLLDEESQRANELDNRLKENATQLERAFEEQDDALSDLDDALSRLRYLERAFKELGEIPTVEADFDDDWRPDSSVDALVAAREVLEFLVITASEDGCSELDTQQKRGIWGKKIWMALRALNDYCRAKAESRFSGDIAMYRDDPASGGISLLAEYAAHESEPTTNSPNLKAVRMFSVPATVDPAGKVYMEQHLKIDKGGKLAPRIHLYDDSGGPSQRIYIGYIGPHLPTWSSF